jgi:hypothetical protein
MTDYIPDWIQDFINDTGAIVTDISDGGYEGYSIPEIPYYGESDGGSQNSGQN